MAIDWPSRISFADLEIRCLALQEQWYATFPVMKEWHTHRMNQPSKRYEQEKTMGKIDKEVLFDLAVVKASLEEGKRNLNQISDAVGRCASSPSAHAKLASLMRQIHMARIDASDAIGHVTNALEAAKKALEEDDVYVWVSADGRRTKITEMDDQHLYNTIHRLVYLRALANCGQMSKASKAINEIKEHLERANENEARQAFSVYQPLSIIFPFFTKLTDELKRRGLPEVTISF